MSESTPKRSGYLPTLDGWRAIAIGMVLCYHTGLPHTTQGKLGVDLFFAISGILICSRLLEEERLTGRIGLRGFYIRRTFRIIPPAYLFLGVLALLALLHVLPAAWAAWSSALVFLRNYFTILVGDNDPFTAHLWSLAVEEHFYLLLPGLLVLFPNRRKLVLTLLILAVLGWVVFYMAHTPPQMRPLYWERRTDLRLNSLLFPALLALLLARPPLRRYFTRLVTPLTVAALLAVLGSGCVAANMLFPYPKAATVAQAYPTAAARAQQTEPSRPSKDSLLLLATVFAVPVVFPFLILGTMLHPEAHVSRWLEWKPLRSVGRISYSIYLWQQLFWVPVPYVHWPIGAVQSHWVAATLTFSCATASYFLVEKPAIRLGHRLAPPPPRP